MKRYILVVIALLFSFLSLNTVFAATFSQTDLTGTWYIHMLRTQSNPKWMNAKMTVNSSGVVTCLSMSDSGGSTSCPEPFDLTFTMNETTGVITQSGNNAADTGTDHATMTLSKNFIAGTGTSNSSYQLFIMQKVVPGTVYSNSDVQNKSLVYHSLHIGEAQYQGWEYDALQTNAAGLLTIISGYDSSPSGGPLTPGSTGRTLSVDANGIVTMSGKASFYGFLSADKKTIVSTDNSTGGTVLSFGIGQITGKTYPAGPLPAGTLVLHQLFAGSTAFWTHSTITVNDSGVMTYSDWVDSLGGTAPTTNTGSIDASGTVTVSENPSFHGQVSNDSTFTVSTQTKGSGPYVYGLSVSIRTKHVGLFYANFTGYGLYRNYNGTWTRINSVLADAGGMVAAGADLYANFTGYGLYKYNGTTWTKINTVLAASMAATDTDLYASFTGYGLYKYNGTTWTKINTVLAASMATTHTDLYATFTGYAGLYKWNGTAWSKINTVTPANMAASPSGALYANFTGYGLYKYYGTTWTKINTVLAASMVAFGTDLYANFTGYGLYKYDGTTWTRINTVLAASMVAGYTTFCGSFTGYGLYKYDGTTWTKINIEAASMVGSK